MTSNNSAVGSAEAADTLNTLNTLNSETATATAPKAGAGSDNADSLNAFLKSAAAVRPNERQLKWFDREFYGFIHISPNTFTGLEWGTGKESPSVFDPTDVDCDQWVEAVKSAGMCGAVITAKHHDGFCLWDTKTTDHNIMNSPYGKDLVKEFSDACRRGGIGFGFYLSPWDRNSKYYGTDEYNGFYMAQLKELLTGYGEVFHVWFDCSCGEGENGKKQRYEFEKYFEMIRKYQPGATIYHDKGPDLRWCGNESAKPRLSEWAVVPSELCPYCEVQTAPSPFAGDLSFMGNPDPDIGTLPNIIESKGLVFAGSEFDVSIRKGWFWHPDEEPWPLERLFEMYLDTVGKNACLNLNVPPDRRGRIDERDVTRLRELGELIKSELGVDRSEGRKPEITPLSASQAVFELELPSPVSLKYVILAEDIAQGQRIESFRINFYDEKGKTLQPDWAVFHGTTVGHKRIISFKRELWSGIVTKKLRLTVTCARDFPILKTFEVYGDDVE